MPLSQHFLISLHFSLQAANSADTQRAAAKKDLFIIVLKYNVFYFSLTQRTGLATH